MINYSERTPLRIGALISGGGRTLLNIADCIDRGELNAIIACVIASRRDIAGVERAQARGFTVHIAGDYKDQGVDAVQNQIWKWIDESNSDLVCLCGWLKRLRVDPKYTGRIMNIHPALLPDYGGLGMYGHHVHAAVIAAGRSESGCTVHFVDDQYDHGPIILQRTCPVMPGDTPETLAARVFEEECTAYPEAIRKFADNFRGSASRGINKDG